MRILVIIIYTIALIIAFRKYKDVICPGVMFNILWIFSLSGIGLVTSSFEFKFETLAVLIAGLLMFHWGFQVSVNSNSNYARIDEYSVNTTTLKMLVLLLVPLFFVSLRSLYENMGNAALYDTLRGDEGQNNSLGGYVSKIIQCISLIYLIVYYRLDDYSKKKSIRPYIITICVMAFICVLMGATRNGMLFYFLPLLVIYLSTHNVTVKKQIFYLIFGLALFLMYYVYISVNKYAWAYEAGNFTDVLSSELGNYLSGSLLAFDKMIGDNAFTKMGTNTFRFFIAISDSLFGTHYAGSVVNDFVDIFNNSTNVFTFYDYYLRDFGILYALFMQFIIARIHGIAYKNRYAASGLYFYSLLSYPLIMQFFQDQYFSILSMWIQVIIIWFVFFKTRIFLIKLNS